MDGMTFRREALSSGWSKEGFGGSGVSNSLRTATDVDIE
jgi:hypothetical protein